MEYFMVKMFDYSKNKYTFVRIFGAVTPRACYVCVQRCGRRECSKQTEIKKYYDIKLKTFFNYGEQ